MLWYICGRRDAYGRREDINDLLRSLDREKYIIVLNHQPSDYAAEAGSCADLVLSGHTHGGQIRLFGKSILSLSNAERRFLFGWNTQSGIPILTSQGIGCEGINMRLGTEPEVWLITLRSA